MKYQLALPILILTFAPTPAGAQSWRRYPAPVPRNLPENRTSQTDWGTRTDDTRPLGKNILKGCSNRGKSKNERRFCREMGLSPKRERR